MKLFAAVALIVGPLMGPTTVHAAPKASRDRTQRGDDSALRACLKALAAKRGRFGYRRLHPMLKRGGTTGNHRKLLQLYREE